MLELDSHSSVMRRSSWLSLSQQQWNRQQNQHPLQTAQSTCNSPQVASGSTECTHELSYQHQARPGATTCGCHISHSLEAAQVCDVVLGYAGGQGVTDGVDVIREVTPTACSDVTTAGHGAV